MRTQVFLVGLAVACGPPAELVAERDALKDKVGQLERTNATLDKEVAGAQARIRSLERELLAARQDAALARIGVSVDTPVGAVLETSLGRIRCRLLPDHAPLTVANFVQLAEGTRTWTDPATGEQTRRPLYDGTVFHRVKPEFMIQGGDPLANGMGGPGYQFADEVSTGLRFDEPGMLAMANSGPNTNGSQFFITDRSTPHTLDGKHTIFGRCQDAVVVEAIATTPRNAADKPTRPVTLRTVRIVRGPAAADL